MSKVAESTVQIQRSTVQYDGKTMQYLCKKKSNKVNNIMNFSSFSPIYNLTGSDAYWIILS